MSTSSYVDQDYSTIEVFTYIKKHTTLPLTDAMNFLLLCKIVGLNKSGTEDQSIIFPTFVNWELLYVLPFSQIVENEVKISFLV